MLIKSFKIVCFSIALLLTSCNLKPDLEQAEDVLSTNEPIENNEKLVEESNDELSFEPDAAVNVSTSEILYKNIPILHCLGSDLVNLQDSLGAPKTEGVMWEGDTYGYEYDGMKFLKIDEEYITSIVSTEPKSFTFDGFPLDKNRDELTDLLGEPDYEGWFGNNEHKEYSIRYQHQKNYEITFYMSNPNEKTYELWIDFTDTTNNKNSAPDSYKHREVEEFVAQKLNAAKNEEFDYYETEEYGDIYIECHGLDSDGFYDVRIHPEHHRLSVSEYLLVNFEAKEIYDTFGNLMYEYSDYNIFAINNFLLGGYFDGKWIDQIELFPLINEIQTYKIYKERLFIGTENGVKEAPRYEPIFSGNSLNFTNNFFKTEGDFFAYSSRWNLKIENGEKLSNDDEIYINALNEYMAEENYVGEYSLSDIYKIDIDGDGIDEVLIHAWCRSETPDYYPDNLENILYLRKLVNGKIINITAPIVMPNIASDMRSVIGFCDLNNDGVKEILIRHSGLGYSGYMVYELKDNQLLRIFENGFDH